MNQYIRELLRCSKFNSIDIDKLEDDLIKYSQEEIENAILKWYKLKKKEPITSSGLEKLIFHPICDRKIKPPQSIEELYSINCRLENKGYNACLVYERTKPKYLIPVSDKMKEKYWKYKSKKYQSETKIIHINHNNFKFNILYYYK